MTDHSPPIFTLAWLSCAKGRKFDEAGGAALAEAGCAALAVAEQAALGGILSIATSRLAKGFEPKNCSRVAAHLVTK